MSIEITSSFIYCIYINNVRISIDGVEFKSIISYMNKYSEDNQNGKLECFFVACCGLKWASPTINHVKNMKHLIKKYNMKYSIIKYYLKENKQYKCFLYNANERSHKEAIIN